MSVIDLKTLYETDDYEWLESTIELLKNRQFNALDLENLIEELEDLGSEKRNAVVSLLEQIIRHLLLLQYWTSERERNQNGWEAEIVSFRIQLKRRLTTNLRNYLQENLNSIYNDALLFVNKKTGYSVEFPDECPYTLEQLLDLNWYPLDTLASFSE
ncbi:DUF29 domain-containing protein [Phormidium sp. LEGE 05292]|uniref:DUF29 domain-containing protein n=1 Tax=[Phormidium] sp. LEGE 05292 TaxID=767427 RepID=UPI001882ED91|nr:DUF29 domain-containing protein [Phormidium sp. LEGE 05292]MBE9229240.1 DUF29 domain-containing protein [Phormidium sp. LEGE 05292]